MGDSFGVGGAMLEHSYPSRPLGCSGGMQNTALDALLKCKSWAYSSLSTGVVGNL